MSPASKVGLVAAPVVLLAARFLLVPYWDEADTYIDQVAEDPVRSDLGASLAIVGSFLLILASRGLADLVEDVRPRLAMLGHGLVVAGCVAMACISMAALVAGQAVRLGDESAAIALWEQVWNTEKLWPITAVHLGALGFIVLAVALYRARAVHRAAAVLLGVGGATLMTTAAGPIRPLLLVAAALAVVGCTWIVVSLRGGSRVPVLEKVRP
jgi:hypothetical protein